MCAYVSAKVCAGLSPLALLGKQVWSTAILPKCYTSPVHLSWFCISQHVKLSPLSAVLALSRPPQPHRHFFGGSKVRFPDDSQVCLGPPKGGGYNCSANLISQALCTHSTTDTLHLFLNNSRFENTIMTLSGKSSVHY